MPRIRHHEPTRVARRGELVNHLSENRPPTGPDVEFLAALRAAEARAIRRREPKKARYFRACVLKLARQLGAAA